MHEGECCLCPLLGQESFPAELVQLGSKNSGTGQAEGIRQLLGQRPRGLALLERPGRIAQLPQDTGYPGEAKDPRLDAAGEEEHLGRVALSVIQGQALFQVRLGCTELTQIEEGAAHCPICHHKQGWVLLPLARPTSCSASSRAGRSSPRT